MKILADAQVVTGEYKHGLNTHPLDLLDGSVLIQLFR